ncbi:MAG: DUF4129 domain-containing protein [Janthinobacterium lividum]
MTFIATILGRVAAGRRWLALVLWLLASSLASQPLVAAPAPKPAADTAARPLPLATAPEPTLRLRQPAAAKTRLDELRRQREFRYAQEVEPAPSAWSLFWVRFWQWLAELIGEHTSATFWKVVLYGLLAGAVVFVVLKLLQVDITTIFGRSPRRAPGLEYDTATENIHELDFVARLREAEDSGNYRLALRLGYLQLLKLLSDQHLIDWQPDKTNHAYLRELATGRPAGTPAFGELTRQFEYVWYGELPLPAGLYRQAREAQQQFGRIL